MIRNGSRIIRGILKLAAMRPLKTRYSPMFCCRGCRRIRGLERVVRAGELGNGITITHIEVGWECTACGRGWQFWFFHDRRWRWMRKLGLAWPMTLAEAVQWGF